MKIKTHLVTGVIATVVSMGMGAVAHAASSLDFASSFNGSTQPWNWDSVKFTTYDGTTGTPDTPDAQPFITGTNQLQAGFTNKGSNGDAAYLTKAVSGGSASDHFIKASFDVSFSLTGQDQAAIPTIFQLLDSNGPAAQAYAYVQKSNGLVSFRAVAGSKYHTANSSLSASQNFALTDHFTLTLGTTLDATGTHVSMLIKDDTTSVSQTVTSVFYDTSGASLNYLNLSGVSGYNLGVISGGSNQQDFSGSINFDNFNAAVPEPASLTLLGMGGLTLMARRRKDKLA